MPLSRPTTHHRYRYDPPHPTPRTPTRIHVHILPTVSIGRLRFHPDPFVSPCPRPLRSSFHRVRAGRASGLLKWKGAHSMEEGGRGGGEGERHLLSSILFTSTIDMISPSPSPSAAPTPSFRTHSPVRILRTYPDLRTPRNLLLCPLTPLNMALVMHAHRENTDR